MNEVDYKMYIISTRTAIEKADPFIVSSILFASRTVLYLPCLLRWTYLKRTSCQKLYSLAHASSFVTLVTTKHLQSSAVNGSMVMRYDSFLFPPAVDDIYQPDRVKEAIEVFDADDPAHPAVAYLRNKVKDCYVGGKV